MAYASADWVVVRGGAAGMRFRKSSPLRVSQMAEQRGEGTSLESGRKFRTPARPSAASEAALRANSSMLIRRLRTMGRGSSEMRSPEPPECTCKYRNSVNSDSVILANTRLCSVHFACSTVSIHHDAAARATGKTRGRISNWLTNAAIATLIIAHFAARCTISAIAPAAAARLWLDLP